MKLFGSKKVKQIKKNDYEDFISILEQIQKTTNTKMQWKHKIKTLDNQARLAIENYQTKIRELDSNGLDT